VGSGASAVARRGPSCVGLSACRRVSLLNHRGMAPTPGAIFRVVPPVLTIRGPPFVLTFVSIVPFAWVFFRVRHIGRRGAHDPFHGMGDTQPNVPPRPIAICLRRHVACMHSLPGSRTTQTNHGVTTRNGRVARALIGQPATPAPPPPFPLSRPPVGAFRISRQFPHIEFSYFQGR